MGVSALSKHYTGWEMFKRPRCKICGGEMVEVLVCYEYEKPKGIVEMKGIYRYTKPTQELECSCCGKSTKLYKTPTKQSNWRKNGNSLYKRQNQNRSSRYR